MSEEAIREVRLQKLARMRELGHDPYKVEKFERTDSAKGLLDTPLPADGERGPDVSFAGRVVSYRLMGKAGFAHLSDGDGKIQGYFRKDELGEVGWELYNLLDIGDHVGVTGYLFITKTGEKSIHVSTITPLSKALHAIPIGKEKDGHTFYGLSDVEARYRHRHLDLIANPDARKMLIDRARITTAVRRYFDSQGYLEVETPMLQLEAGGAAARPFLTHYNAYEMDVKLRISLELYLKRLICGDIPAVYEIGRVFRNEGVSNRHNPEFTLLEFYEAYADMETMMRRVEECFRYVAKKVFKSDILYYQGGRVYPLPHSGADVDVPMKSGVDPDWSLELDQFDGLGIQRRSLSQVPDGEEGVDVPLRAGSRREMPHGRIWTMLDEGLRLADKSQGRFFFECSRPVRVASESEEVFVFQPGQHKVEQIITPEELAHWGEEGFELNFREPWRRVNLLEEIGRQSGLTNEDLSTLERAKAALGSREIVNPQTGKRINAEDEDNLGGLIEKLLEVFVEPTLQEPTFVVGYPIETSPLAKKDPNNPKMTRRFEGYVLGREVCNAFSEINDPIDQRERFEHQVGEREKGDDEAHPMDEEFIYALESGMPPTGGCGIGIDRMAMLLTGADVMREVLFFPMMRPRKHAEEDEMLG
ncbi:MAG TPA: lysine--tRNA ligase [Fimbriimonas sp.]|nr:lysine--tRNA ligase [Fimbriimonas sp.]